MESPEERQNQFFHRTLIPLLNSALWLAALLIGCYSGWTDSIDKDYQMLSVFLIVYCAFMCEGGLVWWDVMAVNYKKSVQLRCFSFIRTIFFNMALTLVVVVLFFVTKHSWLMFPVMATAAWLKYIVCQIAPRIDMADIPYFAEEYELKELK